MEKSSKASRKFRKFNKQNTTDDNDEEKTKKFAGLTPEKVDLIQGMRENVIEFENSYLTYKSVEKKTVK